MLLMCIAVRQPLTIFLQFHVGRKTVLNLISMVPEKAIYHMWVNILLSRGNSFHRHRTHNKTYHGWQYLASPLMTLGWLPVPERDKDAEVSCFGGMWSRKELPNRKIPNTISRGPRHLPAKVRPTRARTSSWGMPWNVPRTKDGLGSSYFTLAGEKAVWATLSERSFGNARRN